MENQNNFTTQNLFHNRVLKNALKQEAIPSGHQDILKAWSSGIKDLNQKDKAAQQAAFLQEILTGILGYKPGSGDALHSLEDMAAAGGFFDAALGGFGKDSPGAIALVKLMGPTTTSLDVISEEEKLSLVELARKQAKEIPNSQFFVLSNLDEIRLYSLRHQRNTYERFSLSGMADNAGEYQRFYLLLSVENMLSGKTREWLDESIVAGLEDKLRQKHPTIRDAYGPLNPGVAVGINDIFVINKQAYDEIVTADPKSTEILKFFYAGEGIKRWHLDSWAYWLIYTPKGKVDIEAYPAIRDYLQQFRDELEKREGDQKWYELDHTEREEAPGTTTKLRVGVGRVQATPGFVLTKEGAEYGLDSFVINNADYYLFGLMNSSALAKLIRIAGGEAGDGMYELTLEHVEALPVPDAEGQVRARLGQLSQFCMEKAEDRRDAVRYFRGMIAYNLTPQKTASALSEKLNDWFELDFETFRNEIRAAGADIPADDLQLWSDFLEQEKNNLFIREAELSHFEDELDMVVYTLFGLDDDEIELIEHGK